MWGLAGDGAVNDGDLIYAYWILLARSRTLFYYSMHLKLYFHTLIVGSEWYLQYKSGKVCKGQIKVAVLNGLCLSCIVNGMILKNYDQKQCQERVQAATEQIHQKKH